MLLVYGGRNLGTRTRVNEFLKVVENIAQHAWACERDMAAVRQSRPYALDSPLCLFVDAIVRNKENCHAIGSWSRSLTNEIVESSANK